MGFNFNLIAADTLNQISALIKMDFFVVHLLIIFDPCKMNLTESKFDQVRLHPLSEKSIEKIVRSIVNKADFLKSWPKQSQENLVSEIVNSCNGDINNALNQIELASYSFQNKNGKTHQ